jgi:hypothetical protein
LLSAFSLYSYSIIGNESGAEMDTEQKPDHKCSQEVVLNTICLKLENIENLISEMKDNQIIMKGMVDALTIDLAKRPDSADLRKTMDDVKTHKTYFMIIGAALTALVGFVMFGIDKLFVGK